MKTNENMVDNFQCKANESGYCVQWLRNCVGYSHCNLNNYDAPCPGCIASSPKEHEKCDNCKYREWKMANYLERENDAKQCEVDAK